MWYLNIMYRVVWFVSLSVSNFRSKSGNEAKAEAGFGFFSYANNVEFMYMIHLADRRYAVNDISGRSTA